jgi:hypothetical protein
MIVQTYETRQEMGRPASPPLRKVVVGAVLHNPYAGRYVEDLSDAVEFSVSLGDEMARVAVEALGSAPLSYGKGAIVGTAGEQEHGVMFITTAFGDRVRAAVGGGKAWISSASVVGAAGRPLLVPLAHKDALYVREHYDAVTLYPDDAPRPDEVVVALGLADRGRPNHRLGGLRPSEIRGDDGLR